MIYSQLGILMMILTVFPFFALTWKGIKCGYYYFCDGADGRTVSVISILILSVMSFVLMNAEIMNGQLTSLIANVNMLFPIFLVVCVVKHRCNFSGQFTNSTKAIVMKAIEVMLIGFIFLQFALFQYKTITRIDPMILESQFMKIHMSLLSWSGSYENEWILRTVSLVIVLVSLWTNSIVRWMERKRNRFTILSALGGTLVVAMMAGYTKAYSLGYESVPIVMIVVALKFWFFCYVLNHEMNSILKHKNVRPAVVESQSLVNSIYKASLKNREMQKQMLIKILRQDGVARDEFVKNSWRKKYRVIFEEIQNEVFQPLI